MRIATWNVNSVNARLETVLAWFREAQPDVACLQEIKCVDERFPAEAFESIGYNAAVHGQKSYNGVALLSKTPLEDVRKAAPQRGPNGNGVPIKMGIPKVGSFEATVSKKKAGELAQMFLAGLLVVMGYIACAMFGVKPPKRG